MLCLKILHPCIFLLHFELLYSHNIMVISISFDFKMFLLYKNPNARLYTLPDRLYHLDPTPGTPQG